MPDQIETDVLVVGAGGAGMRAAYEASLAGARVLVAVKGRFGAIGTRGAGGTAAAISERGGIKRIGAPNRTPEERLDPDQVYEDVIQCGLGLADPKLVRVLVEDAPATLRQLERWGLVPSFAEGYGAGTHGVPISMALQRTIQNSDVVVRNRTAVCELLVRDGACVGALAVDETTGETVTIKAGSTILATGGLGRTYWRNFHPSCVTGDGYALGYRAGAQLFNLEFHQIFIETVAPSINLVHTWLWESYPSLTNAAGEEILERYTPAGVDPRECMDQRRLHNPFSTRDPYSRYIDVAMAGEVKAGRGTPSGGVYVTIQDAERQIRPDLLDWYRYRGVHWDTGPVEISVGHHCSDGGLRIDTDAQTTVPGLFAAGELAAGPHGADRMGGNMLLASQVFGARAGRAAAAHARANGPVSLDATRLAEQEATLSAPGEGDLPVADTVNTLGRVVWDELLVGRTAEGLRRAQREIARIRAEDLPRLLIQSPLDRVRASELRNGLQAAELVAHAALTRQESRGGHHRADFPSQNDAEWLKVIVVQDRDGEIHSSFWAVDPAWRPRSTDMFGRRWG
ncbi:MAG: FAD-binding protein [Chloroflexi bacterium]|nr:FAD-binding protein [Chloroflexota bacterium]